MNDESYKRWDIRLKAIAPIVTVLGLLIGVWQFSKQQSAQLERQYQLIAQNDKLEFKRKVWEKQVDVYSKISSVVGQIASGKQSKEQTTKSIEQFDALYWGETIMVEDKAVEEAMLAFHLEIEDLLKGIGSADRLKVRADNLIKACRESSKNTWLQSQ